METKTHLLLKEQAKRILFSKGFKKEEIMLECSWFKNNKGKWVIDVVGLKKDKFIAIECGGTSQRKLKELRSFFDEVIHLPYLNDDYIKFINKKHKNFWYRRKLFFDGGNYYLNVTNKIQSDLGLKEGDIVEVKLYKNNQR